MTTETPVEASSPSEAALHIWAETQGDRILIHCAVWTPEGEQQTLASMIARRMRDRFLAEIDALGATRPEAAT